MGVTIDQLLSQDVYDALEASTSSPSSSNPFATIADITGAGTTDLAPVINQQNTPPGGPVPGDRYLVGTAPTGAWVGFANNIAEWDGLAWIFTPPVLDYVVYVTATLTTLRYNGSAWVAYAGTAALLNGNLVSSPMRIGTKSNQLLYLIVNNVNIARFGNANATILHPTRFGGAVTTSPDASAQVDIASTTKGFLMPRMTQAQRNAIASPATGLMIFQTDATPGYYYYDGALWQPVGGSGGATIYSADSALTGNRIVDLAGFTLQFGTTNGLVGFNVTPTEVLHAVRTGLGARAHLRLVGATGTGSRAGVMLETSATSGFLYQHNTLVTEGPSFRSSALSLEKADGGSILLSQQNVAGSILFMVTNGVPTIPGTPEMAITDGKVSINTIATPSVLSVAGDIEVIGQTLGVILQDRTSGTRYRVYVDNTGVLFTEAA